MWPFSRKSDPAPVTPPVVAQQEPAPVPPPDPVGDPPVNYAPFVDEWGKSFGNEQGTPCPKCGFSGEMKREFSTERWHWCRRRMQGFWTSYGRARGPWEAWQWELGLLMYWGFYEYEHNGWRNYDKLQWSCARCAHYLGTTLAKEQGDA